MQTKFMSMDSCLNRKSHKGFSVLEGLIALAIISIVMLATYSSYYKLESSSKRLARNNICELHNKKIFSIISSKKLDSLVTNDFLNPELIDGYLASGGSLGSPVFVAPTTSSIAVSAAAVAALKKRFEDVLPAGDMDLYKKRGPEAVGTLNIKFNGTESRMPLLANSTMGYLADHYNNGFKQADGLKDLPTDLIPPLEDTVNTTAVGSLNQRYKSTTKMKLSLYRIADKATQADETPYFPMPANQYPEKVGTAVTKYFPYSFNQVIMAQFPPWMREDLGIKVDLRTQVTDFMTNEVIQNCDNFSNYEYPIKIQNTIDFADFDAVYYSGGGTATTFNPAQIRQSTSKLSSKGDLGINDSHPLAPIFTNYNAQNPDLVRDRNLCSQTGTPILNFYVKFRINNLSKDPGNIPICIDTSQQWLAGEAAAGWCPMGSYTYAASSHVKIHYDWKSGDLGWVPCESLKFCNQEPDKVEVIKDIFNTIEYRYHYAIAADNNAALNRLWGCELKYMAATVDVAGNLNYPSSARPNLGTDPAVLATFVSKLNPEPVKEILPKVYFKPPPCYLCTCKPCKKKKGGFFSFIFALIVFVVLAIATGGASLLAASGYLTASLGVLTAMCGVGQLGCQSSNSSTSVVSSPAGNQFTSCTSSNITHCTCGSTCNKKSVPGPRWIDSLTTTNLNGIIAARPKSCPALTVGRTLGPQTTFVNLLLTYKVQASAAEAPVFLNDTATYRPVPGSPNSFYVLRSQDENGVWQPGVVQHLDEVIFQEFDRAAGTYCISRNTCVNGTWQAYTQPFSYERPDGTTVSSGPVPFEGCFKVKTAHSIEWATTTAAYELQDKPNPKAPVCLEVDFTPGVLNENGDTLKGYNELTHECADVKPINNVAPFPYPKPDFSNPKNRIVGTAKTNICAAPGTYERATGGTVTITPAAAIGITDGTNTCGGGGTGSGGKLQRTNGFQKAGYLYNLLVSKGLALPADYPAICDSLRCWTMCLPPTNMPVGPMNGEEQMYYQDYMQTDRELEFCRMQRTHFDIIR